MEDYIQSIAIYNNYLHEHQNYIHANIDQLLFMDFRGPVIESIMQEYVIRAEVIDHLIERFNRLFHNAIEQERLGK